ncbi:DMT family transporter [Rossellomorea aquimaris]|nr:DMT family transporter [Rossellomorea aquimaris]MCA1056344.1 DMT family transporter [Rossellomorea aquimaris]
MPMSKNKATIAASFYASMSISFWGISFVSTKAVVDTIDPYTLLVLRFAIGALFLFMVLVLKRYPLFFPLRYLPHLIVLGVLGVFVHQVIQATALITIDASAAGWMISFSPVFTVILSMIFLHEKMTFIRTAGMLLAIAGVLMVTNGGSGKGPDFVMSMGYLLMILSTLNWAVYSVLLKKLRIPLPSLVVTFYMSLVGCLLTMPFLLRSRGWEHMTLLSQGEWAHILFLGVFVSGVGYWYWGKALEVMDASKVSMFLYLEPLVTLIAAVLLLHEKILFVSILGGGIIILGVTMVNGQAISAFNHLIWRRK